MTKRLFILILIPMLMSSGIISATATKATTLATTPSTNSLVQNPTVSAPVSSAPQQVTVPSMSPTSRRSGYVPVIAGQGGFQSTPGAVYSPQTLDGMKTPFVPTVSGVSESGGNIVSGGGSTVSSGGFNATGVVIPTLMFSNSKSRYSSNVSSSEAYPAATEISRQQVNNDPTIPFPDPLGGELLLLLMAGAIALLRRLRIK